MNANNHPNDISTLNKHLHGNAKLENLIGMSTFDNKYELDGKKRDPTCLIWYRLQAEPPTKKQQKPTVADHQHLIKTHEMPAEHKKRLHWNVSSSLSLLSLDSGTKMLHWGKVQTPVYCKSAEQSAWWNIIAF